MGWVGRRRERVKRNLGTNEFVSAFVCRVFLDAHGGHSKLWSGPKLELARINSAEARIGNTLRVHLFCLRISVEIVIIPDHVAYDTGIRLLVIERLDFSSIYEFVETHSIEF